MVRVTVAVKAKKGVPVGTNALNSWSLSEQGLQSELLYVYEHETFTQETFKHIQRWPLHQTYTY